jgi:RHS repeat-associated protein
MRVAGITDEPATVKVNGKPAITNAQNQYEAWVDVAAGENTITIEAEDFSPNKNKLTKSWKVNVTGTAKTPAYDLNGNTLTDGAGKSYVWDAENRLTKIIYADNSSTEFQYNGISQRVRVIEKSSANAITSDKRYLWAGGNQPAEERDSSGAIVLKRYFPQGEQIPAAAAPLNKLFYTKDHLGNIRELTDSNGSLQIRYDYDIWGKRIKLSGTLDTEVGYTGHHHHAKSELILTWFRAYDAEMGRWLSADPLGEVGGINLYGYVSGNPINSWDPLGLVDLNITPRNEPLAVEGMDRWNPKGTGFTVGGHGNSCGDGMTDSQGVPLTPERLAELIQSSDKYEKGQTVTLYMCNSGGTCKNGDNFAQRLANILGAGVRAPNGYVNLGFSKPGNEPSRHWLTSVPGGKPDPSRKYIWHAPKKEQNTEEKCEK